MKQAFSDFTLCLCRYELLMQYFQIKLNFGIRDQSHMFVLAGLCGMFTQLVLLRLLLRYLGKRNLLLVGRPSISAPGYTSSVHSRSCSSCLKLDVLYLCE